MPGVPGWITKRHTAFSLEPRLGDVSPVKVMKKNLTLRMSERG